MAETIKVITNDIVNVIVTSSNQENTIGSERRFAKALTIADLKNKLELITGGNASTMKLEIYTPKNKLKCPITDNNAMLGSYPIDDGDIIHVVDNFTQLDVSGVEKFELSEDQYAKKPDTVKAFLMKNKLGKYNAQEQQMKKELLEKELLEEEQLGKAITVGSRCLVTVPNAPQRRGVVMFSGNMNERDGYWIGVKYDEPLGKNNGSFEGKRYFECPDKYGGFVKPRHVQCGDFPEENFDLDEEI